MQPNWNSEVNAEKIEVGILASSSGAGTIYLKVDVDLETVQAIKMLYLKSPQVVSFHPVVSVFFCYCMLKRTVDV